MNELVIRAGPRAARVVVGADPDGLTFEAT
jgi:hypothetical protein